MILFYCPSSPCKYTSSLNMFVFYCLLVNILCLLATSICLLATGLAVAWGRRFLASARPAWPTAAPCPRYCGPGGGSRSPRRSSGFRLSSPRWWSWPSPVGAWTAGLASWAGRRWTGCWWSCAPPSWCPSFLRSPWCPGGAFSFLCGSTNKHLKVIKLLNALKLIYFILRLVARNFRRCHNSCLYMVR